MATAHRLRTLFAAGSTLLAIAVTSYAQAPYSYDEMFGVGGDSSASNESYAPESDQSPDYQESYGDDEATGIAAGDVQRFSTGGVECKADNSSATASAMGSSILHTLSVGLGITDLYECISDIVGTVTVRMPGETQFVECSIVKCCDGL